MLEIGRKSRGRKSQSGARKGGGRKSGPKKFGPYRMLPKFALQIFGHVIFQEPPCKKFKGAQARGGPKFSSQIFSNTKSKAPCVPLFDLACASDSWTRAGPR